MSVTIETIVSCDKSFSGCAGTYCDGDIRHMSATEQRKSFGLNGWHRAAGMDICNYCWKEMANSGAVSKRNAR